MPISLKGQRKALQVTCTPLTPAPPHSSASTERDQKHQPASVLCQLEPGWGGWQDSSPTSQLAQPQSSLRPSSLAGLRERVQGEPLLKPGTQVQSRELLLRSRIN